jgi:pyrimidine-specific ribonucleoside hydrolase
MEVEQNIVFDLETSDPDDILALALLATHPRSNLVAATVYPGGKDQIGLVKHVLEMLGKGSIPVGSGKPKEEKQRVSKFHTEWLGTTQPREADGSAVEIIKSALIEFPDAQLVTGAALSNIAKAAKEVTPFFRSWTCQGGFAGDNIVPPEHRLPKFSGKTTCPTFNLGGDRRAAGELLCNKPLPIPIVRLVAKNVCHGMFYSRDVDWRVPTGAHPGLDFIKKGMGYYFQKHPGGKALHDVVAAVVALNPQIGTWARVLPYCERNGEWGCHSYDEMTHNDSDTEEPPVILTSIDKKEFERNLAI